MTRQSTIAITAAAMLTLLLAGPTQAQAQAPRDRTLIVAQGFDPQTLWPNGTTASDNVNAGMPMVEPLLGFDTVTNKPVPHLVESWEMTSPTAVKLSLRKGVSFSNGEAFDAEAVIHSLRIFTDAKVTPAYSRYAAPLKEFRKLDAHTVVVHTHYPYPALEMVLTQVYVTPPGYWAQAGGADGFGKKPVGTGPFRFTEWIKDNRVVLDRNPQYWGIAAQGIDRMIFRPIPDDSARVAALETGEVDVAINLPVSAVKRIEANRQTQIVAVPSYRIFQLVLSTLDEHASPVQKKLVRQAINHAIDKKSIIDNLLSGRAEILHGQLLRPEQLGFDPALKDYEFDLAKAKALLAQAGHPDGFEVVFKTPSGRYAQDREVSEAIAGMLGKIGVRAKMTVLEPGEFLRQLRNRELWPIAFLGLAPPDDPDFQLFQYRSDWRYSYIKNARLDQLIDDGGREMDRDKRAGIYRAASALIREEAPVAFLYRGVDIYGTTKRLKGFRPGGDQRISFYPVTLERR